MLQIYLDRLPKICSIYSFILLLSNYLKSVIYFATMKLLELVDSLKPLLFVNVEAIDRAISLFEKRKLHDRDLSLESFSITIEDCELYYFADIFNDCQFVLGSLEEFYHPIGKRIRLLDAISVLLLFMNISADTKLSYFFKLYNYNKTGKMTDYEFIFFISRLSRCLKKLNIIGAIDITDEDSKHYALLTRSTFNDSGIISVKPSIELIDFMLFFKNHRIGVAVSQFMEVFNRLSLAMKALDNKLNRLEKIHDMKYSKVCNGYDVPRMDIFNSSIFPYRPFLVSSCSSSIEFCIEQEFFSDGDECYVLCEKIERNISEAFDDDILSSGSTLIKIPWYLYLPYSIGVSPFVRLRIDNLEENSEYQFQIFTRKFRSPIFGCITPSSKKSGGFCLLPYNISQCEVDQLLHKEIFSNIDSIGQISNASSLFQRAFDGISEEFIKTRGDVLFGCIFEKLRSLLFSDWRKYIRNLFDTVSLTSIKYADLGVFQQSKNMIVLPSLCSINEVFKEIEKVSPANDGILRQNCCSLYESMCSSVSSSRFFCQGCYSYVVVDEDSSLSEEVLCSYFSRFLKRNSNAMDDLDWFLANSKKLVVISSSLEKLLKVLTKHIDNGIDSDNKKEVQLRGKYELLHGEYSVPKSIPSENWENHLSELFEIIQRGLHVEFVLPSFERINDFSIIHTPSNLSICFRCLNGESCAEDIKKFEQILPQDFRFNITENKGSCALMYNDFGVKRLSFDKECRMSGEIKATEAASKSTLSTSAALSHCCFPHVVEEIKVYDITKCSVEVEFAFIGYGRLNCVVLECPTDINYNDVRNLILSNREAFKEIGHNSIFGLGSGICNFTFSGLRSSQRYCIVVEPFEELPSIALFTTSIDSPFSISSLVVAPLFVDCPKQSLLLFSKLSKFLENRNNYYESIFVRVYDKIPSDSSRLSNLFSAYRLIDCLQSMEATVSNLPSCFPSFDVNFTNSGKHCQIFQKREDAYSLVELRDIVSGLCEWDGIEYICIVVLKPLVRYLRALKTGRYVYDGLEKECNGFALNLISLLLVWKSRKQGRDVIILTLDDVPNVYCAVFSKKTSSSSALDRNLPMEMSTMGENSLLMDIVSSHHDDTTSYTIRSIAHDDDSLLSSPKYMNNLHSEMKSSTPARKSLRQKNTNIDSLIASRNIDELLGCLRHFILPKYFQGSMDSEILFAEEKYDIGNEIEVQIVKDINPNCEKMSLEPPKTQYYGKNVLLRRREPFFYTVHIVDEELRFINSNSNWNSSVNDLNSPIHPSSSFSRAFTFAGVIIKAYFHPIDDLEIIFGPVVGNVSQNGATVSIELNTPVSSLQCVFRPLGLDAPDVVIKLSKAKAYKVLQFAATDLFPGQLYEIFFPQLLGTNVCGRFRTIPKCPPYVDILVTGKLLTENTPMIDHILHFAGKTGVLCNNHLNVYRKYIYGMKSILPSDPDFYLQSSSVAMESEHHRSMWLRLSKHMRSIGGFPLAAFHIDSISILSNHIASFVERLCFIAERFEMPLRDESPIGALRFREIEELIRNSFRLFFSIPMVVEAFSSISSQILFNSSYFLPILLSSFVDYKDIDEVEISRRKKLMQIVRKVYESIMPGYLQAFTQSLTNESPHNSHVWRCESFAVVMIDLVSGRSKLKKKKSSQEETETDNAFFSIGFLDKIQWKFLEDVSNDLTISHLVIMTEFPFIGLGPLPQEPLTPPDSLDKGQSIEWKPTIRDLGMFFDFWKSWLMPKGFNARLMRDLTLVTSADRSYTTIVQDITTGIKIHQLCLGRFDCSEIHESHSIREDNIVLSDRVGNFRYAHTLGVVNTMVFDSSRDQTLQYNCFLDENSNQNESGFGKIRLWMDSWKFKTIYSNNVSEDSSLHSSSLLGGNIIVGPIIGMMHMLDNSKIDACMVPFLIEVDASVTIEYELMEVFSGFKIRNSFVVTAHRPQVVQLTPLFCDTRYRVTFVSGLLSSPYNEFTINTSINWSESNFAVINDEKSSEENAVTSEFLKDLMERLALPFHGITCTIHLNLVPDLGEMLTIIEKSTEFFDKHIESSRKSKTLSRYIFDYLDYLLESLRVRYRILLTRPSFRNLLCNGFNIFMPTRNPINYSTLLPESLGTLHHLLYLMISRLNQEYFDQLNFPKQNVFSAMASSEDTTEADGLEWDDVRTDMENHCKLYFLSSKKDCIESIFVQWLRNMRPSRSFWKSMWSPNGRVTLELLPSIDAEQDVIDAVKKESLSSGVRLFFLQDSGVDMASIEPILAKESKFAKKLHKAIYEWIHGNPDKQACILCGCRNQGTKKLVMDHLGDRGTLPVITIDCISRCNEYERILKEFSNEAQIKEVKASEVGGKSKKAQLKREAEQKAQRDAKRKELIDMLARQIPDGYLLIECRTSLLQAKDGKNDVISLLHLRMIHSIYDGEDSELLKEDVASNASEIPSKFDYLQIPEWIHRLLPNKNGVFGQDELFFIARSNPDLLEITETLESDELMIEMMEIYEKSRISELSRPASVREVNLEIPGVIPLFVRELMVKIWEDIVPQAAKIVMSDVSDNFIRLFLMSRALPDIVSISSAELFAKGMKYLLSLAVVVKLAFEQRNDSQWKELMSLPDEASEIVKKNNRHQKLIEEVIKEGRKNDEDYDEETIAKLVKQRELELDSEKDIALFDHEKEEYEKFLEHQEVFKEEERIRKQQQEEAETQRLLSLSQKTAEMTNDEMVELMAANEQSEREAVRFVLDDTIQFLIDEALPIIAHEKVEEEIRKKLEAASAKIVYTDHERIADSTRHMENLGHQRVLLRRSFGEKLVQFIEEV